MPSKDASTGRPRRLGRGLSSLVGDPAFVSTNPPKPHANDDVDKAARQLDPNSPGQSPSSRKPQSESPDGLSRLSIDLLDPSPFQAREAFDDAAIAQLAQSIRRSGLMQPVVVRPRTNGRFELVAGERRWRAAREAGLHDIPAMVRELTDEEAAELGIVENVQREDLNPIERARAYAMLANRFGLTHQAIAERVGIERSSVSNLVRMLDLEEPLQDLVAADELSSGHAKVLLGIEPGSIRVDMGRRAATGGWSVRRLEAEVGRIRGARASAGAGVSNLAHVADLERQLSEHLGTRVRIVTDRTGAKGRMEISFYDLDHFDGLMSQIGFTLR